MEWRIREASDGSFHAEYGGYIESGIKTGFKPGFYMPGFRVQKSSRFDTRKEAEKYIGDQENNRFAMI